MCATTCPASLAPSPTLATSTWLLPWRLASGAVLLTAGALAIPAASLSALYKRRFPPWRSSAAVLMASGGLVMAEACFAAWWQIVVKSRLEAMPPKHGPGAKHQPEKDFQKMLDVVRLVRIIKGGNLNSAKAKPADLPDEAPAALAPGHAPVLDVQRFLSEWFCGADYADIHQDNAAELLVYAFYYKSISEMQACGLGHVPRQMVDQLQEASGTLLPPGYKEGLKAMFHLWEPLPCSFRPLSFYIATELIALWTRAVMTLVLGFKRMPSLSVAAGAEPQGRQVQTPETKAGQPDPKEPAPRGEQNPMSPDHPPRDSGRPPGQGAGSCSPGGAALGSWLKVQGPWSNSGPSCLSMYIRRGSQEEAPPILFLHGVGAGLFAYLPLVDRLSACGRTVVCMEAPWVSMRLCADIPTPDQVAEEIVTALDSVGIQKVACVAHSYGTFVAACLAKHHLPRLHSLTLIDPVCFGVYLPALVRGFVYRRSERGSPAAPLSTRLFKFGMSWISSEVHMAATFCRRFYWSDVNLWTDELPDKTLVVMSGLDDLLHVDEVHHILRHHTQAKILFHDELRHAELLVDGNWQEEIIRNMLQVDAA